MNLTKLTKNAKRNGVSILSTEWRLLIDDIHEARHHFAVEEALARLLDEGKTSPTLRLRQVHPAVFVGVHQNTWSEVDVAYCQANGIQIVRRMNGGGAVYHEMGSFCFSAFFQRDMFSQSDDELYHLFAAPVIRTCSDYNVIAHYEGRNDVLVGNRKIYGSAQFSWYHAFVQSGTFLVNINFEVMERSLTPSALKFEGKSARSIQERVTSLSREAECHLETREVMNRFAEHAAEVLGIRLIPGDLTQEEQELAFELLAAKYSTDKWNFGSGLEFQITVADRSEFGVVSLSAELEGRIIKKIRLNYDLTMGNQPEFELLETSLSGSSIQEAQAIVTNASISNRTREIILRLLEKLHQENSEISSTRRKE